MSEYVVEGECSKCGECCKHISVSMKTSLSPKSYCIYIHSSGDKKLCEIREAYEKEDKDFLEMIPEKHLAFWLAECKPYPDPDEPAHRPPRHIPVEGCTYRVVIEGS